MSTASVINDAQHQMWDMSRAMMRLSWAMTVLGAQQAANMMTPSKMAKSGASMATAFDAMSSAIEAQFGSSFQRAYRAGSAFALAPLEGLPSSELNRAMQSLAMQPMVFGPMKMMMPQLVASISAFMWWMTSQASRVSVRLAEALRFSRTTWVIPRELDAIYCFAPNYGLPDNFTINFRGATALWGM